jgi:hypothetical protein
MDKNKENILESSNVKIERLETIIENLSHKMVILEQRIMTLEREKYSRFSRTPSFLTGDPFMFPPESG